MAKKKKSSGGSNPFMERFKEQGPRLIKVDVEGQGMKWVDARTIRSMPYDPEVLKMGGAQSFANFIHQCLYMKGIGVSEGNYFHWDVRTYNKWWCDPKNPDNFPLKEPGPGRFIVPVYLFMITKIGGKPFKWACYAEVEDILRGYHGVHQEIWVRDYCQKIQTEIVDKLKIQNEG